MGEWMYRSTFSWPRHWLEVTGQLHAPSALPPGKSLWYPFVIGGWVDPRAGLDNMGRIRSIEKTQWPQLWVNYNTVAHSHLTLNWASAFVQSSEEGKQFISFLRPATLTHSCTATLNSYNHIYPSTLNTHTCTHLYIHTHSQHSYSHLS
jgi:hypothetical protein